MATESNPIIFSNHITEKKRGNYYLRLDRSFNRFKQSSGWRNLRAFGGSIFFHSHNVGSSRFLLDLLASFSGKNFHSYNEEDDNPVIPVICEEETIMYKLMKKANWTNGWQKIFESNDLEAVRKQLLVERMKNHMHHELAIFDENGEEVTVSLMW